MVELLKVASWWRIAAETMKQIALFLALLPAVVFATDRQAAAPPTYANVKAAYNLANDGDRVIVPAGTVTWATTDTAADGTHPPLVATKCVEITGAGAQTQITGSGATDLFVLDVSRTFAQGKNVELGYMILSFFNGNAVRIAGVNFGHPEHGFRVKYVRFKNLANSNGYSVAMHLSGSATGLIDHVSVRQGANDLAGGAETLYNGQMDATDKDGVVRTWGDASWTLPRDSRNAVYVEDSVLGKQCDGVRGARVIVRHCTSDPSGWGEITHGGMDSSGNYRGTFQQDTYNCLMVKGGLAGLTGYRGGSGYNFNNFGTGGYAKVTQFYAYNLGSINQQVIFGGDGTDEFDENDRAMHNGLVANASPCNGLAWSDPTGSPAIPVTPTTNSPCVPSSSTTPQKFEGAVYADMTYDGHEGATVPGWVPAGGKPFDISFPTSQLPHSTGLDDWKYFTLRSLNRSTIANRERITPPVVGFVYIGGSHRGSAAAGEDTTRTYLTIIQVGGGETSQPSFSVSTGDKCEIRHIITFLDALGRGEGRALNGRPAKLALDGGPGAGGRGPIQEIISPIYVWNSGYKTANQLNYTLHDVSVDDASFLGTSGSQAQFRLGVHIINGVPPDVTWDINAGSANPTIENWIGADEGVRDTFFAGDNTAYAPHIVRAGRVTGGSGTQPYPHWFRTGDVPTPTPATPTPTPSGTPTPTATPAAKITSAATATFVSGCGQSYQITTTNFSPAPSSYSATVTSVPAGAPAGQLPSGVVIDTATGTLSDNGAGAVVGNYGITLGATNGVQSATSSLSLTMSANALPTCTLGLPNGTVYTAPATIVLNATNVTDANGPVARVEFLRDDNLLGSDTSSPYSRTDSNVGVGSYKYTAHSVDGCGALSTDSSITVTVSNPVSTPSPTPTPAELDIVP
jgi:hypothetical protein